MPAADTHPHLVDDEYVRYTLREPREIGQVLHGLVAARAMITASVVSAGPGCLTALLAVHDDGSLVLCGSRQQATSDWEAPGTRLLCSTRMDLVQIRFSLSSLRRIVYDGYPAFAAPWPEDVLRLQRRDLYRLQVSPAVPMSLQVGDAEDTADPASACIRVLDISGGGLALAVPDGDEHLFCARSRVEPCWLRLPEGEPMPVVLEVVHRSRQDVRGVTHWRAGCRFIGMPAASERRILQSIFQIERQRNARQRRGG